MKDKELPQILKGVADRLAGAGDRPGLRQVADAIADRLDRLGATATHDADAFEKADVQSAQDIERSVQRPTIVGSETRTGTDLDRAAEEPQLDNSASAGSGAGLNTTPHPLKGLWLERKVEADTSVDPFTSIMDLPHDEATRIAYEMGKRFDGDYVTYRREVESWLRSNAAEKGNPSADSPLYFKLVSEQGTYPPKEGSAIIRIPADSIPVEHLTFTVEDSFFNYLSLTGTPDPGIPEGLVPQVISGLDADTALDFDGQHRDFLLATRNGRYIEAQVWSRDEPILAEARRQFQAGIPTDRTITVKSTPPGTTPPDDSNIAA